MSKRRLADRRGLVEYLGGTVSPDAIATWVHAGKIRPIQLHAKKWLFDLDDIDNLLDRLKRGPEPISA